MQQTKEQLIADLYALRSGLSYISEQTDALKKNEEETETSLQRIAEQKKQAENNYATCLDSFKNQEYHRAENKKHWEEEKRRIEELRSVNQREYDLLNSISETELERKASEEARARKKSYVKGFEMPVPPLWLLIVLGAFSALMMCSGLGICTMNFLIGFFVAFGIPITFGVIYLIVALIKFVGRLSIASSVAKRAKKEYIKKHNQRKETLRQYLDNNYSVEYKEAIQELQRATNAWEQFMQSKEESRRKHFSEYETKMQEYGLAETNQKTESTNTKNLLTGKAQEMKLALNNTYDSWLSESDWQNTDLLIYYLETRRADDLKEALLLVDKQRQTDQIVRAVREAGIAVQTSIETSMARLGDGLARSFSVLSSQLERVSSRLSRMATAQEESLAASERNMQRLGAQISENLSAQVSAMELNNSLLKKSNSTSEELLNDLRYNQRFWVK
ncbi:MAG: hypothetical protein IJ506_04285 [Clostridia bacterium]|nr:hypothetical protein [Clostridia bacterium]